MTKKARKEAERYLQRSLRPQKRLGYSAEEGVYEEALQATARAFQTLLEIQSPGRPIKAAVPKR